MRPTKLSKELAAALFGYLEEGFSIRSACVQEDIDVAPSTVFAWMARGRSVTRGIYFDFVEGVEEARAKGAARLEGRMYSAALEGDPQAARACDTALKTLYREWYGAKVEVTGVGGGPVTHEISGSGGGPVAMTSIAPEADQLMNIARILRDALPNESEGGDDAV